VSVSHLLAVPCIDTVLIGRLRHLFPVPLVMRTSFLNQPAVAIGALLDILPAGRRPNQIHLRPGQEVD
jgi:hypothetical protein